MKRARALAVTPSLAMFPLAAAGAFALQGVVGQKQVQDRQPLAAQEVPATPGSFPAGWIHGSSNCTVDPDPPIQVHAYKDDTYILRQTMCLNFEGPFMYLLFGKKRALLIDTGATSSAALFPLRATVQQLVDDYETANGLGDLELIVTHSHGHGDHLQADPQFAGQPNTTVVGTSLGAVQSFFNITSWPDQVVTYDLGQRVLDILPIPGHQTSHVAYYDRRQDVLFTGDTLYPGFLFITNQSQYRESIDRLVAFAADNPVLYVLGGHIEMSSTPGVAYPYGTAYQPQERELQLTHSHLLELQLALRLMPGPIVYEVHDDFIIDP